MLCFRKRGEDSAAPDPSSPSPRVHGEQRDWVLAEHPIPPKPTRRERPRTKEKSVEQSPPASPPSPARPAKSWAGDSVSAEDMLSDVPNEPRVHGEQRTWVLAEHPVTPRSRPKN